MDLSFYFFSPVEILLVGDTDEGRFTYQKIATEKLILLLKLQLIYKIFCLLLLEPHLWLRCVFVVWYNDIKKLCWFNKLFVHGFECVLVPVDHLVHVATLNDIFSYDGLIVRQSQHVRIFSHNSLNSGFARIKIPSIITFRDVKTVSSVLLCVTKE
jgi:hypothetical protein